MLGAAWLKGPPREVNSAAKWNALCSCLSEQVKNKCDVFAVI